MPNPSPRDGGNPPRKDGNTPRKIGSPPRRVGNVVPGSGGAPKKSGGAATQVGDAPRKIAKKRRRGKDGTWSITTVAWALAVVIGLFGWAFAAANYAHAVEGWSGTPEQVQPQNFVRTSRSAARATFFIAAIQSLGAFLWNALVQIPNAPWVVVHVFRHVLWLVAVILVLEGLVVFFVKYDCQLQREDQRGGRGERPPD